MGRTWVLRTETKGTGAEMVPLESVQQRSSTVEPVLRLRRPVRLPVPPEPKPRPPHKFRVVDVMTRQTLLDGASAQEAVDVLKDVRSIVDVDVYVWHEERDRWQRLTFGEQRALLDLARRPTR